MHRPDLKKIGILRGMESSFPEALIERINKKHAAKGVLAEFCAVDAIRHAGTPGYAVILDRISHEVPFYRSYLKWAALHGTYVVNDPFWWSADDKFIENVIAERAGVAVPKTVLLPHKQHPPHTEANSFRNLLYPIDWESAVECVGFPAFLKPHDGGGWRGVTKVENRDELFAAYDASGTACMMLQESIEFEAYFRCYGIGRSAVRVMKYNPAAPIHLRYADVPPGPVDPDLHALLRQQVLALCEALGYEMNTVEFAVRAGVPYAIDFMNPAPDADYQSVGAKNFEWVVQAVSTLLVRRALRPPKQRPAKMNGLQGPHAK